LLSYEELTLESLSKNFRYTLCNLQMWPPAARHKLANRGLDTPLRQPDCWQGSMANAYRTATKTGTNTHTIRDKWVLPTWPRLEPRALRLRSTGLRRSVEWNVFHSTQSCGNTALLYKNCIRKTCLRQEPPWWVNGSGTGDVTVTWSTATATCSNLTLWFNLPHYPQCKFLYCPSTFPPEVHLFLFFLQYATAPPLATLLLLLLPHSVASIITSRQMFLWSV
jgi:hypothetical protein